MYAAQWDGSVYGETYRVETDLEVYDPESYIFFRQCMDNSVLRSARKGAPDEDTICHLTAKEWESWFTTGFLVEWCEWGKTLDVFTRIDKLFRWYKVYRHHKNLKMKIFDEDDDDDENKPLYDTNPAIKLGMCLF